jgi:hypothetical protein
MTTTKPTIDYDRNFALYRGTPRQQRNSQRKMVASTFEMLLGAWFDGDAEAMWAAVEEYKLSAHRKNVTDNNG